jgi:hypothetical protein
MKTPEELEEHYMNSNKGKGNYLPFTDFIKQIQDDAYLQGLKDAEMGFRFMSDMSTKTQGFHNLQERIKKLEDDKSGEVCFDENSEID